MGLALPSHLSLWEEGPGEQSCSPARAVEHHSDHVPPPFLPLPPPPTLASPGDMQTLDHSVAALRNSFRKLPVINKRRRFVSEELTDKFWHNLNLLKLFLN